MKNSAQKFISRTMEKKAVDLFLRQIGIMPDSEYFKSEELRQVISSYIASRFESIHCCVLNFKMMDKPQNPIVMYLKKNRIDVQYKKFSIVISSSLVRCSENASINLQEVYKELDPITPKYFFDENPILV